MKTASWIILVVAGALTLLAGLISLGRAYYSPQDVIGPARLSELSAGNAEVVTAVRARRATAAAYCAGFATLFLAIVLGPYRRGEAGAWWTILAGTLVLTVLTLLRVPLLGTWSGAVPALVQLGVVGMGLVFGVGRLRRAGTP